MDNHRRPGGRPDETLPHVVTGQAWQPSTQAPQFPPPVPDATSTFVRIPAQRDSRSGYGDGGGHGRRTTPSRVSRARPGRLRRIARTLLLLVLVLLVGSAGTYAWAVPAQPHNRPWRDPGPPAARRRDELPHRRL